MPSPLSPAASAAPSSRARLRTIARYVMAAAMTAIGVTHFTNPEPFVLIVPSFLPAPLLLVYLSGAAEIAGGLGLLHPRTRRLAGWCLVLLYLAVFPANINMAVNNIQPEGATIPTLALWARLPFQVLFIAWAIWVSRSDEK